MEQLIPVIEFIKKHSFWLICGLVTIASFATWYLAAGSLEKSRKDSISSIDSMQRTAQGISRVTASGVDDSSVLAHPNKSTEEGMQGQIDAAAKALIRVWRVRREEQAEILQWPADVIPEAAKEFIEVYKQFDPPEAFSGLANQDMGRWLAVYKDKIPKRMMKLCDAVGTKWDYDEFGELIVKKEDDRFSDTEDEGDMFGKGAKVDVPEELPVVVWREENQSLWNDKLTDFKGRDGQSGVDEIPTPIQVIMLQQDLWLLEAMFDIIKELNGDADANDIATIKEILHVVFGREAMSQLGVLTEPNPRLALTGVSSSDDAEFENYDNGGNGSAEDDPDAFDPYPGEGKEQLGPFHGRYVDKDFQPLSATEVQDILKGKVFPEENLELLVAKRVPVRIALRMDERKIDDFIAACANSPFAFEIWQVRVNRPLDPIELGGSFQNLPRSNDSGYDDDGYDDDGYDAPSSSPFSSPTTGQSSTDAAEGVISPHRRSNHDITVEFYGIVKIYNPVNEDLILNSELAEPAP